MGIFAESLRLLSCGFSLWTAVRIAWRTRKPNAKMLRARTDYEATKRAPQ